jgi:hypothetical protein
MDSQSKIDTASTGVIPPSSHWTERATEVRARAAEASNLDVRVILEHIASLYDALAKRPQ